MSFHFCEMEGKVFLYAERQLCSWYRMSAFSLRITAMSSNSPFYLHFFSSSVHSSSVQKIRRWFNLFIAAISLCYFYNVSIYEYRLKSITTSDSHEWSISLSLEHGNHGNHTISDVICNLFLEQTKRFFYITVLHSIGATLYYTLHAHSFLLPQIVPHMIHAVSFASVRISQKIGCDSSTSRARITPTQL